MPENYLSEMPPSLVKFVDEEAPQPWHELTLQDTDICEMTEGITTMEASAEASAGTIYTTAKYPPLAGALTEDIKERMRDVRNEECIM